MYIVTRRDLSPGFQACQASHAAFTFSVENPDLVQKWHTESNFLVIVTVEDEDALRSLLDEATERGILSTSFIEPDLDNEMTAIVLEPSLEARRLVANLPLALREEAFV